ncbi:hypothetical protein J4Q44_G00378250 [Coregonus suidteri]|uniref:ZP-domain containing protein Ig-like domain-containing protein n=1 Tax=Coregonus suidteri TaxID=861788 RepID=A0AAN8Q5K1_9TELE
MLLELQSVLKDLQLPEKWQLDFTEFPYYLQCLWVYMVLCLQWVACWDRYLVVSALLAFTGIEPKSHLLKTVTAKRVFTMYLGNFPYDVDLVAVKPKGHYFTIPEAIQNVYPVTRGCHAN